ncbi:MAG: hypothetical protein ACM3TR_20105 [Caulobacteraceae bacterium]
MPIKKELNDEYPELNNNWVAKLPRFRNNAEFEKEKERVGQRIELYKKYGNEQAVFRARRWLSQISAVNAGAEPKAVALGKYDNYLNPPAVKPRKEINVAAKYPWDNQPKQQLNIASNTNPVKYQWEPGKIPTLEQAKKAWEHGGKGIKYYNAMTEDQKKAFWTYGADRNLIDFDKLNDLGKVEYNKYVDPLHPQYKYWTPTNKQYNQTQSEKIQAAVTPSIVKNMVSKTPEQVSALGLNIPTKRIGGRALQDIEYDERLPQLGKKITPTMQLPKIKNDRQQRTVVQQGKLAPAGLKRPDNPFAPVFVNAANVPTLGLLERNNEALQELNKKAPIRSAIGSVLGYTIPLSVTNKVAAPIANKLVSPLAKKATGALAKGALNVGKNVLEGAIASVPIDLATSAVAGDTKQEFNDRVVKGAAYGAIADAALPLIGKGLGKVAKTISDRLSNGILEKVPVTAKNTDITPNTKIVSQGTYKVKNTALDKAIEEYNNAIETIQNHFQTNELRTDEMARIKPELGIDLDNLIKNIEDAEKGISVSEIGRRRNLSNAAGVTNLPKLNKPTLTPNPFLGANKVGAETAEQAAATALKPPEIKPKNIELPRLDKKPKELKPLLPTALKPVINGKEQSLKKTVLNSPLLNPEMKQELKKKPLLYNPLANVDTLERARQVINSNYDEAIRRAKDGPATAENNAIGMELVRKLQGEGRYSEAIDIIENISRKATESGQAIQALSMWGRLTPEGMLKYTQKLFDKVNNQLTKEGYSKLVKRVYMTEDFAMDITERMTKINAMPEGRAKTVEIAKVLRDIDEQIPKSVWRKVSTIQTMAQLLNPKTMVRNTIGNAIFGGLENISNAIGTPIDAVVSKLTGQRTTIMPSLKTQAEAGAKGFVEAVEDALQGIDTRGLGTKFELGSGNTFKRNTLLGKLETGLNVGLRATDAAFSDAAKAESLRQQMKIAGVTEPTPGMIEIADKIAKYRTFQDSNGLSEGFKRLKEGLNRVSGFFTGTTEWGLGDLVLKYSKTPANILARGIDYSPVSVIKAINEATKPLRGKVFNQKEFVDALARGATGTGLIVLGYQLNKLGLVTGAPDKDYDVASLKRDIGQGEYRLNTTALQRYINSNNPEDAKPKKGDTYVSWDWAAPTSIMLGIGANVGQSKGNTADLLTTLVDASVSGLNTLVEQPLLTGVQKLTGGYDPVKNIANVAQGAPASFTPSILNQVKQLTDNTTRNYYSPDYGKEAGNMVKARLPILSKSLQPRITTLGKVKETYQGDSNNLLNVFLNPAYVSKYDPTPAAEMVLDIYEKSGEKIQFPRVASTYIMRGGKRINLLPNQVTALQKYMGEETLKTFNEFAKSPAFRKLPPEEQAKKLQSILTKISQEAKEKIILPQLGIK